MVTLQHEHGVGDYVTLALYNTREPYANRLINKAKDVIMHPVGPTLSNPETARDNGR